VEIPRDRQPEGAELDPYRGARAQRGARLSRGFQAVTRLEVV
jgi:hypothetical protein